MGGEPVGTRPADGQPKHRRKPHIVEVRKTRGPRPRAAVMANDPRRANGSPVPPNHLIAPGQVDTKNEFALRGRHGPRQRQFGCSPERDRNHRSQLRVRPSRPRTPSYCPRTYYHRVWAAVGKGKPMQRPPHPVPRMRGLFFWQVRTTTVQTKDNFQFLSCRCLEPSGAPNRDRPSLASTNLRTRPHRASRVTNTNDNKPSKENQNDYLHSID